MRATGRIETIGTIAVSGNENQYQKRSFLVDCTYEHMGQIFKNHLEFTLEQESVAKLDSFKVGDRVHIEYAPLGRKYEAPNKDTGEMEVKHFQYLKAWDIVSEAA